MAKRKGSRLAGHRVCRLTVTYRDARNKVLDTHSESYVIGSQVRVDEKLFTSNGKILVAPAITLTMPRHDVVKDVWCHKLGKRKSSSRHD